MKISPHIVKMTPHLVQKVWGGRRLHDKFGKTLPDEAPYGEAWEVADLDEGQSHVASGPLKGRSLRSLCEGWGREFVGRLADRADRFPLLVKLLDAHRDLSVQVHPGKKDAQRIAGAASKEETWLILDSRDGAVVHGLSENGVRPDEFRRAVEQGAVEELLQRISVAVGDVVHVPPKTIHAICRGVALLEIQEPSDTTYRVYDYDRPGLDGKPRELHLEQAMAVARLGRSDQIVAPVPAGGKGVSLLASCPSFRVERIGFEPETALQWQVDPDSPQVVHLLEGSLVVGDGLGDTIRLDPFETAVVPAKIGTFIAEAGDPGSAIVAGLDVEDGLVDRLVTGRVAPVTS